MIVPSARNNVILDSPKWIRARPSRGLPLQSTKSPVSSGASFSIAETMPRSSMFARRRSGALPVRILGAVRLGLARSWADTLLPASWDDLLRLVFAPCHPSLSAESRVALTLRVVGGLTTEEIASAFVISEVTAAQRIVRAKNTLAESGAAFEVPRGKELAERLSSVLEVIYFGLHRRERAAGSRDRGARSPRRPTEGWRVGGLSRPDRVSSPCRLRTWHRR
jgi:hypothetical protein